MAKLIIKQLNCHKSKDCSATLARDLASDIRAQILCLQEPHAYKNRVCGFHGMESFFVRSPVIRAAIIIPKHNSFNAWFMPEYSSGDIASVTISSTLPELNDLIIASVYCDIDKSIPPELESLVALANRDCRKLIICADSNSHSLLCVNDSNSRGDLFENFIFTNNLELHNHITSPTFVGRDTNTFIDITLSQGIP